MKWKKHLSIWVILFRKREEEEEQSAYFAKVILCQTMLMTRKRFYYDYFWPTLYVSFWLSYFM